MPLKYKKISQYLLPQEKKLYCHMYGNGILVLFKSYRNDNPISSFSFTVISKYRNAHWNAVVLPSILHSNRKCSRKRQLARSSFYHWGAKTEKSCDFTECALFHFSDGGTSQPSDVEKRSYLDGACGLTSFWRETGVASLMALKASTIMLNQMQAAKGSQWRSRRWGVTWIRIWEDCKRCPLKCSGYAATV